MAQEIFEVGDTVVFNPNTGRARSLDHIEAERRYVVACVMDVPSACLTSVGHPQWLFFDGILGHCETMDPEGKKRSAFSGLWFSKVPAENDGGQA